MNIDDIKLTRVEVKALKKWLQLDDRFKVNYCPFSLKACGDNRNKYCTDVCNRIYILEIGQCPCKAYKIKEVIKNTKLVIRNNPSLGDRFKRWLNGISM
jgi:hypothetical protein